MGEFARSQDVAGPDNRGVAIRRIVDADHVHVLRINRDSQPAVAALEAAELQRLLHLGGLHLVAEADGAIVGYALTFSNDDPYDGEEFQYFAARLPGPFLYVDQIAADRHRQRAGVGRRMYEALIKHARSLGIYTLCWK